jgi:hypothetical protein
MFDRKSTPRQRISQCLVDVMVALMAGSNLLPLSSRSNANVWLIELALLIASGVIRIWPERKQTA